MARYTIQAPDGRKITIEAGDEQTALRGAQEWAAANPKTKSQTSRPFWERTSAALVAIPQKYEAYTQEAAASAKRPFRETIGRPLRNTGPGVGDLLNIPLSAVADIQDALIRPVASALTPQNPPARTPSILEAVRNRSIAPVQQTREQAVDHLTGEIGLALSAAAPARVGGVPRLPPRASVPVRPVRDPAIERVLRRQDLGRVGAQTQQYRAAGINPTLTDVLDEGARGTIRAAASKQTPARQIAADYAETAALDLPNRMSAQARRLLSRDTRTPDQIREAIATQRRQQADQAFGAVRNERIPLDENSVQALRTDEGRSAIRAAAQRAARSLRPEDRNLAAELNRLADDVLDKPGEVRITVGSAQTISEALKDAADTAARAGRNYDAASFNALGNAIRENARTLVPAYGDALRGYQANSQLMDAADLGEQFLTRNTDEFVQGAQALDPAQRELALAAARRAIERRTGESTGQAPGVARAIANAPEQQARNAALLGQQGAQDLQDAMRLESLRVRNAADISPRTGSQTQLRQQDAANQIAGAVQTGVRAVRGDWIGLGLDWLRSRGISDREAQRIVELSTTPSGLQEAVAYISARQGPGAAAQFLQLRSQAIRALPLLPAAQQPGLPSLLSTAAAQEEQPQ